MDSKKQREWLLMTSVEPRSLFMEKPETEEQNSSTARSDSKQAVFRATGSRLQ